MWDEYRNLPPPSLPSTYFSMSSTSTPAMGMHFPKMLSANGMMRILIGHVTALIARVLQCSMCPPSAPSSPHSPSSSAVLSTFCFHCDLRAFKYISLRLLPTVICIMQMRLGTRNSAATHNAGYGHTAKNMCASFDRITMKKICANTFSNSNYVYQLKFYLVLFIPLIPDCFLYSFLAV